MESRLYPLSLTVKYWPKYCFEMPEKSGLFAKVEMVLLPIFLQFKTHK